MPGNDAGPSGGGRNFTGTDLPQPGLQRLNGAIQEIERLTRALENHVEKTATLISVLRHDNNITRAKLEVATDRINFLEEFLEIEPDDGEEGAAQDPQDASVMGGDGSGDATAAAVSKQLCANTRAIYQRATNDAFKIWMGVTNLSKAADLPGIPGPGEEAPLVPTGQHAGTRLVRFNWLQNATYPMNARGIETLTTALRAHGNSYVPGFGEDLEKIFDADLKNRVITKFKALAANWKRIEKSAGKARAPAESEPVDVEDAQQAADNDPLMDRKIARSRAKPKQEQRKRKSAGTKWAEPKYETAFTENAASDDEDMSESEVVAGEKTCYVSRPPWFRSAMLQECYNDLDLRNDPEPDRAALLIKRRKGPVKLTAVPPRAQTLKNRLRVWMITEDALEGNPHWLTGGRVAQNGKLWGDEDDPADDSTARGTKRKGESSKNSGGKKKKRPAEDMSKVQAAEASRAALARGADDDDLFGNMTQVWGT
ncbi:uncharacterized protein BXZ73DRAFT_49957 [Epithele typhae]|uniref:uncharacterized protein n=1 Tax=Epithele typhae TaxID=378194 RepID=UPI0020079595|nr:uncharacterized protein BXZ73DRAFT_49957 [Epithele typhae]KAH9925452.1 hypothetical protein BXZ73DRAFT_49957 [Epithele typhae]